MEITICITTFKRRLNVFKNLVNQIKKFYPDIEILVAINGEYNENIDDKYRSNILSFIASKKNVIPYMYTEFRSLSKIWNNLVINSRTEYNLILNDDLIFENENILQKITDYIQQTNNGIFTINGGWSHFVVSKTELDKLGYFDERLLTIGEEDGDMVWRHLEKYNKPVQILYAHGIKNLGDDYNIPPTNINTYIDNKPLFNSTFIKQKYKQNSGYISGMFGMPCSRVLNDEKQYPYEMFYLKNKKNIGKGDNIEL